MLAAADKALVAAIAVSYLALLAWMCAAADTRLLRAAAVPAATLVLASALRAAINAPRPYQLFDIDPLVRKGTCGKSLPSRHVASATVIACVFFWANPLAGAVAFCAAAAVAYARVAGGVHFPRDVAWGVICGMACGILGLAVF